MIICKEDDEQGTFIILLLKNDLTRDADEVKINEMSDRHDQKRSLCKTTFGKRGRLANEYRSMKKKKSLYVCLS
jgi:hypothetical protein